MPRKSRPAHVQTTYTERVVEALGLLCSERPPVELVQAWCFSEDDRLQEWALNHSRASWAQGIGVIDAACTLADNCEEGHSDVKGQVPLHLDEAQEREAYQKANGTWVEPDAAPDEGDAEVGGKLLPEALDALETLAKMAATFPDELSKSHPDVVNAFAIVVKGKKLA